jgi:hypothetical protein
MANTFQIKRRTGNAPAFDPSRVNNLPMGGVNNEYKTGDKVFYNGKNYVALHNNDALLPTNAVYWQELTGPVTDGGAPASLLNGELAFNEVDNMLYYGMASGAVQPIVNIGGAGNYVTISTDQTVAGDKAFTASVVLSSAIAATAVVSASGAEVANTEFVQNVFAVLDGGYFDDFYTPPATSGTGKYFYSTSSTDWSSMSNWFTNVQHTAQAATLPTSATDVVVLGSVAPVVNLDAAYWVQPKSINSGTAGIVFGSVAFGNVSCDITGNAVFNGSSTYNK